MHPEHPLFSAHTRLPLPWAPWFILRVPGAAAGHLTPVPGMQYFP